MHTAPLLVAARTVTAPISARVGRELTGTGGGEPRPVRFEGSGGGRDEPSRPVLGLTKADAGGGRRRGSVGRFSSTCAGTGALEAGLEGSRGGRLGQPGSARGTAGADRVEISGGLITWVFSVSVASLAAWDSLSFLDGGSGGSFAWSKTGASIRRVDGESTEVVLARDKDRLEMDEIWEISDELEPRLEASWCVALRGGNVGVSVAPEEVFWEGSGGRPGKAGGFAAVGSGVGMGAEAGAGAGAGAGIVFVR